MPTPTLRIADNKVWQALRTRQRMHIFEAVRSSSGCTALQLSKRLGISPQLTFYHMNLLLKAGLLQHTPGRRYRDKGGKFTAVVDKIVLRVDVTQATQMRRARNLFMHATSEAQSQWKPTASSRNVQRCELLDKNDWREIDQHMKAIEVVLDRAAKVRVGRVEIPSASHCVVMALQPLALTGLPTTGWRCVARRGRGG